MTAETVEARGAFNAAQAAQTAAKNATITQNTELSDMRGMGGQLIKAIKAFAELQPDPSVVYTLASIPPNAAPVSHPPEAPFEITHVLDNTGALSLKWKGNTQGGSTIYSVSRSVKTESGEPFGPFEQVGLTGSRVFTDGSIPQCTISAQYIIKAYKGSYPPKSSTPTVVRFTAGADAETENIRFAA